LGSAAAPGVAVIAGPAAPNGLAFIGQTGGTGNVTKSIVPWAIVDSNANGAGISFATADSSVGGATTGAAILRALDPTEMATSLVSQANVFLNSAASSTAPLTVNSLTLDVGGSVSIASSFALTLDSGGILALTGVGVRSIGNGLLTTSSNRELIVHALGDLDITSAIVGTTGGLTKSGLGTLTLGAANFYTGATTINQGNLQLAAGSVNSIFYNNDLIVNAGGTLDLNGGILYANRLRNDGNAFVAGNGGTITSTAAATLVLGTANVNWAGKVNGSITVARAQNGAGSQDWNIYDAQGYSGKTLLYGGRTQLLDSGTLLNTSEIEINHSNLLIQNGASLGLNLNDRIKDTAPITMRGGMIQYRNRQATASSETFGALTIAAGQNIIEAALNGVNINSSDLAFASLTQAPGSRATIMFHSVGGLIGSNSRVLFSSAPSLINNLIANAAGQTGWAVSTSNITLNGQGVVVGEFSSYASGMGVGRLSGVGYAGYAGAGLNNAVATDNVRLVLNAVSATASSGSNLLTVASTAALNVGDSVTGTGVPDGAVITSINSGTQFTISQALTAANPVVTIPQRLSADRVLNTLSVVASRSATIDLNGKKLRLQGGGLILSQTANNTDTATILSSLTTSNIVTVASVPASLTVGSSILGSTVVAIDGTTITLAGNSNSNVAANPVSTSYTSAVTEAVQVISSSTSSPLVTVAAVPVNLTVGSALLGSTVAAINDLEITLAGNANDAISNSPVNYTSILNGNVEVLSSSIASAIVTVSTVPSSLTVGASLLGSTITAINGNTITLENNAESTITTTPLNSTYTSTLPTYITVTNGDLTSGQVGAAADLYIHALPFGGTSRLVNIGANIVDNGVGGTVSLVLGGNISTSGLSGAIISGDNSYTGGTFVNSGTWILNTSGADGLLKKAIPGNITIAGGIHDNNNVYGAIVRLEASHQILNTATASLMGASTLNLNGSDQALGGLFFNNTGGAAPTLDISTGSFTLNGDLTANAASVGNIAQIINGTLSSNTISGSNIVAVANTDGLVVGTPVTGTGIAAGSYIESVLNGTSFRLSTNATVTGTSTLTYAGRGSLSLGGADRTFTVNAINTNGQNVAPLQPTLNISAPIVDGGTPAAIIKQGNGVLQLGGASTFTGGVELKVGGILVGSSSIYNSATNGVVTAGPLGTGTLTMSNGTTLLASANQVIGNSVIALGGFAFDSPQAGAIRLTLGGPVQLTDMVDINVINPNLTAALGGTISGPSGVITITKTGLGTLALGGVHASNTVTLNLNAGSLALLNDGDGTGSLQSLESKLTLVPTGGVNLTIGRLGTTYLPLFTQAANKKIRLASFALSGPLMLANNNGYGLEITGAATLGSGQLISVATASDSNQVKGLTFTGKVSGSSGITKIGAGTLVLADSTNDFVGLVDIQSGVVEIANNGALGDTSNKIRLNTNTATSSGLRAAGTFHEGRTIILATANNAIEVTAGNTLTLDASFELGAPTNALRKNDNGTLELTASNSTWNGILTIGSGAVRVSGANANILGTTTVSTVVTGTGAALQLNGVTIGAEPLTLNGSGINNGGALQAFSGSNTVSGTITLGSATTIGADSGTTLILTGALSSGQALTFAGAGTINKTTTGFGAVASITKMGSGIFNLGVTSGSFVGGLVVNEGTFQMGTGVTIGGTGTITIQGPSGVLELQGGLAHMTGARALTLNGGKLMISGAAGSTQLLGTLTTNRSKTNVIDFALGTGTNTLTFNNLVINGDSSLNFTGTLNSTTNRIAFTTTPGLTNGIIQRALVNGTDFATYNGSAGTGNIQATAYDPAVNSIDGAVPNTANVSLTATPVFTASKTINALKLNGNGINVGNTLVSSQGATLSLNAGAILNIGPASSVNTLSVPRIQFNAQAYVAVATDTTLISNSLLTGTGGFVKDLGGTLVINAPDDLAGVANLSGQTLTGNFAINAGTVKLGDGIGNDNNTLTPNQFMLIAPGATLDLNGTSQFVFGIRGDGAALQGNAGTVTNSSVNQAAFIIGADNGGFNWGGVIKQEAGAGAMSFLKSSPQQYNFLNESTHSGATVFAGGVNLLADGGRLTNTSSIAVNYAYLQLNDNVIFALANRVNTSADITLRGGSLVYQGRIQTETSQSVGNVILAEGYNMIQAANGGTGINSATLNILSLIRPVGSTATLRFPDNGLGAIGSNGRIIIPTFNFNGTDVSTSTVGAGLTNNLIGPWAVVDREFASYAPPATFTLSSTTANSSQTVTTASTAGLSIGMAVSGGNIPFGSYITSIVNGTTFTISNTTAASGEGAASLVFTLASVGVGRLNQVGYAGYSINTLNGTPLATDNIRAIASVGPLFANTTVNTFAMVNPGAAQTTVNLGGFKLTLQGGGLLLAHGGDNRNISITNGTITSGTLNVPSDLYIHALPYGGTNRTAVIDAAIVNNGTGAVRMVFSGSDGAANLTLNGTNTYTGGTVVNGGVLIIGSAGAIAGGGITINGGYQSGSGILAQQVGGTIASSNIVTLNGTGLLVLAGQQTLQGLVFNGNGGGTTPPTVTSSEGLLTIGAGGIVSNPFNPASTALLTGRVDLGTSANTVTVNTYDFDTDLDVLGAEFTNFAPTTPGLIMGGLVGSSGGFTKNGDGVLQINQSLFTGTLTVAAGNVQSGAFNGGSRFADLVLGAGTSLNLNGQQTVWGSLGGSGSVFNSVAKRADADRGLQQQKTPPSPARSTASMMLCPTGCSSTRWAPVP
jgi:autotransporter-associated beta strand protein